MIPDTPIRPTGEDVLIVVDVQHDFLPGGALAVPDGDAVIAPILALAEAFDHVILTQDWHPPEHVFGRKTGLTGATSLVPIAPRSTG